MIYELPPREWGSGRPSAAAGKSCKRYQAWKGRAKDPSSLHDDHFCIHLQSTLGSGGGLCFLRSGRRLSRIESPVKGESGRNSQSPCWGMTNSRSNDLPSRLAGRLGEHWNHRKGYEIFAFYGIRSILGIPQGAGGRRRRVFSSVKSVTVHT